MGDDVVWETPFGDVVISIPAKRQSEFDVIVSHLQPSEDPFRDREWPRLAEQYQAPKLRGPFNLDARRAAGFDDAELAWLEASAG